MDLENLVTDALSPPEKEKLSPEEIITRSKTVPPGQLADMISETLSLVRSNPADAWGPVSEIVAYSISSSLSRHGSHNVLLLLHTERATQGDSKSQAWVIHTLENLEDNMRKTEKSQRRSAVVGSFSSSLDYLGGIFGEDTLRRISELTGAKKPTAKRWVNGGTAQWSNSHKVTSFASALYALIEEKGMSENEVIIWLDRPIGGGESPFELWKISSWRMQPALQEELEKLGVA